MSNCIPYKTMDASTCPCPNLSCCTLITGGPDDFTLICMDLPLSNLCLTVLEIIWWLRVNNEQHQLLVYLSEIRTIFFLTKERETMKIHSMSWTSPVPSMYDIYDDVIKWKHFPRYWPSVKGIHRSLVDPPHKDQWHGALIFLFVPEQTLEQTMGTPVIWDAIVLIMTSLQCVIPERHGSQ